MIGALLLGIFCVMAALMYTGKLPALLALPLLALALTLASATPHYWVLAADRELAARLAHSISEALHLAFAVVIAEGIPRLHVAIFTIMLGGIFGQFLKLTGVAEAIVRRVAELAGDRPFSLTLVLTLVVGFLFTALNGLGSVILVANIYFPVLLSLGVPPLLTACLFLMGFSWGGVLNLANWAFYLDVLKMAPNDVLRYAFPFALASLTIIIAFILIEFRKARIKIPPSTLIQAAAGVVLIGAAIVAVRRLGIFDGGVPPWMRRGFVAALAALLVFPARGKPPWTALLAPFVPIGLVLFLGWTINPAFFVGILYLLKTSRSNEPRSRQLVQSVVEGVQGVAPAAGVMMGIGMVLVAVMQKPVIEGLQPILMWILPRTKTGYVLTFTALAPLALYRGPLNLWGMGSGLMGLIQRTGLLGNTSIMAAFLSTGQIQGVCDPTNTHNVWIANQLKVDLNAILRKTLPYMWVTALLGLLLGVYVQ